MNNEHAYKISISFSKANKIDILFIIMYEIIEGLLVFANFRNHKSFRSHSQTIESVGVTYGFCFGNVPAGYTDYVSD